MALEITQVLLSAISPDAYVRNEAESTLCQFRYKNIQEFLLSLSAELSNEGKPTESRQLAGIVLENSFDAKIKDNLVNQWVAIEYYIKSQIKSSLLNTLGSSVREASHTAALVVAKIAFIEIPRKEWPELVGLLLYNMTQLDRPVSLKQATLETLGYVCAGIPEEYIQQNEVNAVLAAVLQGMTITEKNPEVRLAATRALYNAIDFALTNCEIETQRSYIMKVICDAAEAKESEIRHAAFECLVSIASIHYKELEPYMERILELTSNAFKGDEEAVALQAIEFWSSICDEELNTEDFKVPGSGNSVAPRSQFIMKALPILVPILLETLLKQDQDDGIWNIGMAGATCLCLIAQTVGDDVVSLVIPFVQTNISKTNISKTDWQSREAAISAFSSILEGPSNEKLSLMVDFGLVSLLNARNDENSRVKNLIRIFELLQSPAIGFSVITPSNLQRIVGVLLQSLKDTPHVAVTACRAIYLLAQGYKDAGLSSSLLTPYLASILHGLLMAVRRTGGSASELRSSASEIIDEVVRVSNFSEPCQMILKLFIKKLPR